MYDAHLVSSSAALRNRNFSDNHADGGMQQSTIRVVIVTSSLPEWNVCQRKAGGLDYFRRFLTACFVGGFCSIYGLLQALNVTANAFGHTSIIFYEFERRV